MADQVNGLELNVRISQDEMQGFLSLPPLEFGESYRFDEVMAAIERKGLRYGIDEKVVHEMVDRDQFNMERLIATGEPMTDGIDAFYQFNFDCNFSTKPTIRPDGSVDYWSIHVVEIVEEGQVIAVYHEPIAGKNGMSVKGKTLLAKRGKPLTPLVGKGFERSEDGKTYVASLTGKIEKNESRIQISPVYEVFGNVDLKTGNIDFRGDVLIHGNVLSGTSIIATGTVTVDGIVEAAKINAKKEILLRGGVLGKGKAVIHSDSSISAKFLEYCKVECEGFLEATSALDCQIIVHDKLLMTSPSSTIVGGHVYASRGIELYSCGNESEVSTELQVGMDKVMAARAIQLRDAQTQKSQMLERINEGILQFEELAKDKDIDISKDERRLGLLRARISAQADVAKINEELIYINNIIEGAKGATVSIIGTVHAGVSVVIDNTTAQVKETQTSVTFVIREGNVIMIPVEF